LINRCPEDFNEISYNSRRKFIQGTAVTTAEIIETACTCQKVHNADQAQQQIAINSDL
jgi:hypothetical protein